VALAANLVIVALLGRALRRRRRIAA
jgi:hypothetical protein